MLNPNQRLLYLAQLTPPDGYRLEGAIATTFSLDLLALLAAPVAMVMQDHRLSKEAILNDPVSLLEAIRRTLGHVLVFCQQGRIAAPSAISPLFSYLEQSVVEVQPPAPKGVFHPKAWFLRFEAEEEADDPMYRFVCLTRNLTFDRSWNTTLTLEGRLQTHRIRGYGQNQPLTAFLNALSSMAAEKVPKSGTALLQRFISEVPRVRFEVPDGFDTNFQVIPLGIPGYKGFPHIDEGRRNLVFSPFITAETVLRLLPEGADNTLISRAESLDDLSISAIKRLGKRTRILCMDSGAEKPEDGEEEAHPGAPDILSENRNGLHAKMLLCENGRRCRLFTGSANATGAAFNGHNVELMVMLSGTRRQIGVDALFGDTEQTKYTLRSLLRPYLRAEDQDEPDQSIRKKIEKRLEEARKILVSCRLKATVHREAAGLFRFEITPRVKLHDFPQHVTGIGYPITLPYVQALALDPLFKGQGLRFKDLPAESLTGFVAFRLSTAIGTEKGSIAFALNLPVAGLPADRDSRVLASILSDQDRFVRYLLMILGEGIPLRPEGQAKAPPSGNWRGYGGGLMPLLEDMVRAYSRSPGKIKRIKETLDELKKADVFERVVPHDFLSVWQAFLQALDEEPKWQKGV